MFSSLLYLLDRGEAPIVLSPDSDGVPTVASAPGLVLCCDYLALDFTESRLITARNGLGPDSRFLFVPIASPDGPPYRSGIIFSFQQTIKGSWFDGTVPRHGAVFRKFVSVRF